MKSYLLFSISLIIIIAGILTIILVQKKPSIYEDFATCLAEKEAIFYGTFWCPHCLEQKRMFENVASLPYVECSLPDKSDQTKVCKDAQIQSYPTWEFADGMRVEGTQTLEFLAEKTGCVLPVEPSSPEDPSRSS